GGGSCQTTPNSSSRYIAGKCTETDKFNDAAFIEVFDNAAGKQIWKYDFRRGLILKPLVEKSGDINTPALSTNGYNGNEYVFDPAQNPPTLTIICKVDTSKLGPDMKAEDMRWRLVEMDGTTTMLESDPGTLAWEPGKSDDIGTPAVRYGKGDDIKATFTGLPAKNSSFGKKKAKLYWREKGTGDPVYLDEAEFEIFWPKCGSLPFKLGCCDSTIDVCKNRDFKYAKYPGPTSPIPETTWFHYWGQVPDIAAIIARVIVPVTYMGDDGDPEHQRRFGSTRGCGHQRVRDVLIYANAGGANTAKGDKSNATGHWGIDDFAETLLHEAKHVSLCRESTDSNDPDFDTAPDSYEISQDVNMDGTTSTAEDYLNGDPGIYYFEGREEEKLWGPGDGHPNIEMEIITFLFGPLASGGNPIKMAGPSDCDKATGLPHNPSYKFHRNSREGFLWERMSDGRWFGSLGKVNDDEDIAYCEEEIWREGKADMMDWGAPGPNYFVIF
ncbi:hypothetical protein HZA56_21530, partial [Candidatus Poribacteria bacterium]|nr:hypothetical protein [Candidatus Poribacteria bacterium]